MDAADIGFGWSYFDSEDQLFATASGQVMDRWGQALPARAVLLIIWVGLLALFRGITEIVLAFEFKSVQHP